jgi:hypothetical protein
MRNIKRVAGKGFSGSKVINQNHGVRIGMAAVVGVGLTTAAYFILAEGFWDNQDNSL